MVNKSDKQFIPHISWIDPIKAMALLAIMLNHFVEELLILPALGQTCKHAFTQYFPNNFLFLFPVSNFSVGWAIMARECSYCSAGSV